MDHVTFFFLLISMVTALTSLNGVVAIESRVPMNKDDNKCGNVFVLGPSQDIRLVGSGKVPDGYCGVTVFAPPEVGNYSCDAICVTFKTISWSTCDVKLKFVGHKFRKEGDVIREFNCHSRDKAAFCMDVQSLRLEVIEDYTYAYETNRPLYEFDIDANARCTKDALARKVYHTSREEFEADEMRTYGEGIAVGVSLACVFLIVLFIAWCYTKHQAVTSGPSDSSMNASRKKGNIISSFRAKLHTKKKSDASDEPPPATYRKTEPTYVVPTAPKHEDPEAATELSPLTESKEASAETYELASETPKVDIQPKLSEEQAESKDGGQDSPKDGGDITTQANNLDPAPLVINEDLDAKSLGDSAV